LASKKLRSKGRGRASEVANARIAIGKRPPSAPLSFDSKYVARKVKHGIARPGGD
jgi:hypothetical protein